MATDIVNFEQQNLVHICAKEGKLDLMKLFVNKGADPKGKDAFDKLPIEYAKDKEIKSYLKTFGK
jgi:ankyrin repeat protein